MLWAMFVFALLGETMNDPLAEAESRFQALTTYRVTVRSTAGDGERHVLRYFYRKPGWVRMEFIQPYEGLVLIYNPGTHRVRGWPFGLNRLPRFNVAPDNPLIRGPRGHRVDRSDVGTLLAQLRALSTRGSLTVLGNAQIGARPVAGFEIRDGAGGNPSGAQYYRVWLAQDSLFPLRVERFGTGGRLLESVDMADVEIDAPFPERFFTP
ncbi:LolA family protein [Azotobacter armeniacus]